VSQIAEETGIGRATLYKYFPDVEAILLAWHERQVTGHLRHLAELRDGTKPIGERLEAVLEAYAVIHRAFAAHHPHGRHPGHGTDIAALLHRGAHVARAQQHLNDFVRDLLAEAAAAGEVRDDVAPEQLASYCLHALTAAAELPSKAAVCELVQVTLAGCGPPADSTLVGRAQARCGLETVAARGRTPAPLVLGHRDEGRQRTAHPVQRLGGARANRRSPRRLATGTWRPWSPLRWTTTEAPLGGTVASSA
jgi:AcrR family transcriptional regulator